MSSGDRTEDVSPLACSPTRALYALMRAPLARVTIVALAISYSLVLFSPSTTSGASQANTTVSLVSQTDWARGPAPMALRLGIKSTLPRSDLGLKVTIYSRLTSRYTFGISETGKEPSSELVLGSTPIIPLDLLNRPSPRPNTVALAIRFITAATPKPRPITSPELALDCPPGSCDGVYPLEVVVVDRSTDKPLASLTTHLIYLAGSPGRYRLKVALVWTFGTAPALDQSGLSTLSREDVGDLGSMLDVLHAHRQVPITILAYPQMLLGLSRTATRVAASDLEALQALARRAERSRSVEFVGAPFTAVSPTALATANLSGDFISQLTAGRATYAGLLGATPLESPFTVPGRLNDAALSLLSRDHLDQVVVPESNVLASGTTTSTAPFEIRPASAHGTTTKSSGIEAFVADSGLASHFTSSSDPILAAHDFLADVAQIFFESPFAPDARGVVVDPPSFPTSTAFLSIILNGLESSPITKASTLAELFSSVRVGANSSAPEEELVAADNNSTGFSSQSIGGAHSMLDALESVVPQDRPYIQTASESVMLAETFGLSSSKSGYFASGPAAALKGVKEAITLSGARTVTITQRRARVPVTLISTFPSPVHAKLHLESGALTLSPGASSVVLARKNTPLSVSVDARTSGVSTLAVELVSPRGGFVLLNAEFTVRSTAFSIVAVIISAVALAVLFGWWLRTLMRRRRRRAEARRAVGVTPATGA